MKKQEEQDHTEDTVTCAECLKTSGQSTVGTHWICDDCGIRRASGQLPLPVMARINGMILPWRGKPKNA